MKKFFSLVLALVMALSLTTVAWGATPTVVHDEAELKAALSATPAQDVIFANDITVAASRGGYKLAGIVVSGQTVDGDGHTLTVTGANGTWDCGIYITGGTVKNLSVEGSFRGIFTAAASADIFVDNVVLDNVCYTFNSDGGNKNYGVYFSNSILNGWTSFSDVHKEVVFTNCNFGAGTGSYTYAFCRPYNSTEFVGCDFDAGYEVDLRATATVEDCTYDGDPLTAETAATVFGTTATNAAVSHAAAGSTNTYTGLYASATSEGASIVAIEHLAFFKAVDNEVDEDGAFEEYGNVAYYTVTGDQYFSGKYYVEVKTLAKADVVVYTDAAGKNVYMYLDQIEDPFYYGDGIVTKNFGTACGQYNAKNPAYDKKATYYVAFETLYVGDKVSPTEWLMVNGEMVGVDVAFDDVVAHAPVYTRDEDGEIVAIKCSKCGAVAVEAPNFLSMPKNADRVGNTLWYFPAAGAIVDTETKVESAETFDAGIAMYVGMSVMAAAGSAVVIGKKKD